MVVLMERIVRPHLPDDTSPKKTAPKCFVPEENKVAQFTAPSGESRGGIKLKDKQPKPEKLPPKPQESSITSSWSHSYKKYMTKKEKEQTKCDPLTGNIVTAGAKATDQPAPPAQK